MKKGFTIAIACILLGTLSPILFRRYTVPLVSRGGVTAFVSRPLVLPWNENEFGVYAGKSKVFGLWVDAWDFPAFIYPFADGQRYLCVYNDDTSVLVFVVDLAISDNSHPPASSSGWPTNDYARNYLAGRITNVMLETAPGTRIRLPTSAELEEGSRDLTNLTSQQFRKFSIPAIDLGVYRLYWTKENLLKSLEPNRQSVW